MEQRFSIIIVNLLFSIAMDSKTYDGKTYMEALEIWKSPFHFFGRLIFDILEFSR